MTAFEVVAVRAELARLLNPLRQQRALVGLDVDGTLVYQDGSMSEAVRTALNGVRQAGHEVMIATGRSLGSTLPIVQLAGITDGWCVSSNGAVTAKISGGKPQIVDTVTFNPQAALGSLKDVVPKARFAVEMPDGSFLATQSFKEAEFDIAADFASIDEMMQLTEVLRVVVTAPDMDSAEFHQVVADAGVSGCEYAIGWSNWIDMSPPGVTKAYALEALRQRLGIDLAHTVDMGDGANDIDMLSWAGVGVAMGQVKPHVLAAADVQTLTLEADGAALALQQLC